jgi:hypothetical protein
VRDDSAGIRDATLSSARRGSGAKLSKAGMQRAADSPQGEWIGMCRKVQVLGSFDRVTVGSGLIRPVGPGDAAPGRQQQPLDIVMVGGGG